MAHSELIPVDIVALVEDQASTNPIVVLHDRSSNRLLPIWIGDHEARAISMALNHMKSPRPLTHALIIRMIESLGGKLLRAVVDRMKRHTYYASLFVEIHGNIVAVDARPSDAIALALEAQVPILVAKEVMLTGGQENPFPGMALRQEKRQMTEEDLRKMKKLLETAREREQASGAEGENV